MRCIVCGTYLDTRTDGRGGIYTFPASFSDAELSFAISAGTDVPERVPSARRAFYHVNASPCPECRGRGYNPDCIHVAETCDTCAGIGKLETRAAELRRVCVPCSEDMTDNADRARRGWTSKRSKR
jgi:RecJ-like exonuclease